MSGRPAPLSEHRKRAEHAWTTIQSAMRKCPQERYSEMMTELRESARRSFWFYPLVEAQRGLPE